MIKKYSGCEGFSIKVTWDWYIIAVFFCCQSCHVCVLPPYFIIPYTLTKIIETLDESAAFACLMYCLCIHDMHWRSLVSIMDNIVECLE